MRQADVAIHVTNNTVVNIKWCQKQHEYKWFRLYTQQYSNPQYVSHGRQSFCNGLTEAVSLSHQKWNWMTKIHHLLSTIWHYATMHYQHG